MDYNKLVLDILENVGGEKNVRSVTHCATRLRLYVFDENKINLNAIDKLEGVLKAQIKAGQLQIVIGSKVENVYDEFVKHVDLSNVEVEKAAPKKMNLFNKFFEMISSIIMPLMMPLMGTGLIKCISLVLVQLKLVSPQNGFMVILNMVGDALFYFFPFFLAVSAAKRFKANPYMALVLAACLMHPTILDAAGKVAQTGISSISFLGLPIPLVKYSSTLIPIIFSTWLLSKVQPKVEKVSPSVIKLLFVPLVTLLIMVPIELIVIGPFGFYAGNIVGQLVQNLYDAGGFVTGFILGFLRPILVMFGMHYAIQPIMAQQIATLGYSTLIPSAFAANIAQAGAVFAVFFLTRDKNMKAAASSSTISAIFGITEPAIYGVNLKYKRPFIAACLAAGIVSAVYSIFDVRGIAFVIPNILSAAALATPSGSVVVGIIGVICAFILGFVLTFILGIKENKNNVSKEVAESQINQNLSHFVYSPVKGEVKDINTVNDKVFAQELVGKGVAIVPSEGKVYSPFDGVVETLLNTKHAIGIISNDGVECLVHIGIDTVNLEGKYFTSHVKIGDTVKKGDLLIEFDIDAIKKEGYDITTPVVVTNTNDFSNILKIKLGNCVTGEKIIQC